MSKKDIHSNYIALDLWCCLYFICWASLGLEGRVTFLDSIAASSLVNGRKLWFPISVSPPLPPLTTSASVTPLFLSHSLSQELELNYQFIYGLWALSVLFPLPSIPSTYFPKFLFISIASENLGHSLLVGFRHLAPSVMMAASFSGLALSTVLCQGHSCWNRRWGGRWLGGRRERVWVGCLCFSGCLTALCSVYFRKTEIYFYLGF